MKIQFNEVPLWFSASAQQEFYAVVERADFSTDDFEVDSNAEFPPADAGLGPVTGTVTVKCKRTGVKRTYPVGPEIRLTADAREPWVIAFEKDLADGKFED